MIHRTPPHHQHHRVSHEQTPVISVENLVKVFGTGDAATQALRDVSFDVAAGEYLILFGPSGCGKSTILHTIAGLEPITDGSVRIRGENLRTFSESELAHYRSQKVGLVFQQFNILKSLTVLANVALPQLFSGVPKATRERRAKHLLSIFGIDHLAHRIPTELSGGQQQRVAIARALATNPWILLFDEPTGNLDSKAAHEVLTIIDALNRQSRRTIIMVTHNPDQLDYADRVLYLADGRIIKEEHRAGRRPHVAASMRGFDSLAEPEGK